MFHELQEHPGLWFVAATLTPLASFVLLLLAGGLRWALRPARESDDSQPLYQFLSGSQTHRISAYIATGAMALAFLFSLIGAANYAAHPAHEPEEHSRLWAVHLGWARISVFSPSDSQAGAWQPEWAGRASVLRPGYHIDSLTIIMFLMLTFIGGLIHLCSYLLISFYYERQSASNAANKAFIVNRVGDAGFIIGLLIFWSYLGTFNFQEIFNQIRCPVTNPAGQFAERAGEIVRANPLVE